MNEGREIHDQNRHIHTLSIFTMSWKLHPLQVDFQYIIFDLISSVLKDTIFNRCYLTKIHPFWKTQISIDVIWQKFTRFKTHNFPQIFTTEYPYNFSWIAPLRYSYPEYTPLTHCPHKYPHHRQILRRRLHQPPPSIHYPPRYPNHVLPLSWPLG